MNERWQMFVPEKVNNKDLRTDWQKARAKAPNHNLSFCPYGCQMDSEDLDPQGYCRHLVGFTLPAEGKHTKFHPLKFRANRDGSPPTADSFRYVDGSDTQTVLDTDHLERVTVSCRVYRNVDLIPKAEAVAPEPVIVPTPVIEPVAETQPKPAPKRRGPPKGYKKKKAEPAAETAGV